MSSRPSMRDSPLVGIDWKEVRRRIAETPISVPPKHVKRPNRSPESLELRRERARIRNKEYREEHKEQIREWYREWQRANPEKVREKKRRYYEKLKQDPERLERKRQRNREYKARKRHETLLQTRDAVLL